jgi:predicted double-glycine peptidase
LGGCTTVSAFRGFSLVEGGTFINGVPPVMQDATYSCGHTCLAAVAAYWGVGLERFRSMLPGRLPVETSGAQLQAEAETLGLQAFVYRGSVADLERNLSAGRPLIVMIPLPVDPRGFPGGLVGTVANFVSSALPRPAHWVVLLGVGPRGDLICHDPRSGTLLLERAGFLSGWARLDNTCVLVAARWTREHSPQL